MDELKKTSLDINRRIYIEQNVEMDEMLTTLKNENEELKKELAIYKKGESVKILEIPLPYAAEITEHMAQEGERITKIIIVTEKF